MPRENITTDKHSCLARIIRFTPNRMEDAKMRIGKCLSLACVGGSLTVLLATGCGQDGPALTLDGLDGLDRATFRQTGMNWSSHER